MKFVRLLLLIALLPCAAWAQMPPPRPLELPPTSPIVAPVPVAAPIPGPPPTTCLLSAEFLHWWTNGPSAPPLVTTSSPADAGVLGAPSTQVLAGGKLEFDSLTGFRLAGRYAHDATYGLEGSGFFLANGGRYNTYLRQTLAIPYVNPATQAQTSLVLASPNGPSGYAAVQPFGQLWSAEAHATMRLEAGPDQTFEALVGGRFLMLLEDLRLRTFTSINTSALFFGQSVASGTTYTGLDQFEGRNHFAGAQAGVRHRYVSGRCSVETTATLAAGLTRQEMNINGNTSLSSGQTALGGVFAQTSNLGRYTRDVFAVVPQGRVAVGFRPFELVAITAGVDAMYWSGVVRPNEQIDTNVFPSLIPAVSNNLRAGGQPLARYTSSGYWAIGLSLGAEVAF